jgi:hypothetical protein
VKAFELHQIAHLHLRLSPAEAPWLDARGRGLIKPRHLRLSRLHGGLYRNGFFLGFDILQHRRYRRSGFLSMFHFVSTLFGFICSIRSIGFIRYMKNDIGPSEQIEPIKPI